MLLLSHLEPVISKEVVLGKTYILLSSAQEQIYLLRDCDLEFIKIFGPPHNYNIYSCEVEEKTNEVGVYAPFYSCETPLMYKHRPRNELKSELVIDWSQ